MEDYLGLIASVLVGAFLGLPRFIDYLAERGDPDRESCDVCGARAQHLQLDAQGERLCPSCWRAA